MARQTLDYADLLRAVRHPARYTGGEPNSVIKDPGSIGCRVALIYPDLYELGMSYLGLQVLYHELNSQPDIWAERAFAPDLDMQRALERAGLPLVSLESGTPLGEFDLLGFSLQHELNYPDLLAMLAMSDIPLRAEQRGPQHPLVVAGGPGAANPEPLAPALDAVFLGDGEHGAIEMARAVGEGRRRKLTRREILDRLMQIPGVYLPSRYRFRWGTDGRLEEVVALDGAPARIRRRLIEDLDQLSPPARTIVGNRTVHDRLAIEIQRGCTRGCRFCQAGMINRPVRQRSAGHILKAIDTGLAQTGHGEISLLSLSAGDHPNIQGLLEEFYARHADERMAASLPSLRADTLTPGLARIVKTVRKSGFTIAPEAGSERLRRVINKNISDEDVLAAAAGAFGAGWRLIKLYFMVGLPTETERDRDGIIELVARIRRSCAARGRAVRINVGISTFVPKAHTPFQWERMLPAAEAGRIHAALKAGLTALPGVKVGLGSAEMSQAEGTLARGDRRLFDGLERLVLSGQRLWAWSEHFDWHEFRRAFEPLAGGKGLDGLLDGHDPAGILPWDHLDMGPDKQFLLHERELALAGGSLAESTPDCALDGCYDCGACREEGAAPVLDEPLQPAGQDRAPAPVPVNSGGQSKRLRLVLSKHGPAACLSHIEFMDQLTKAMRRAGLPFDFSHGFHPKPRMSFGPACQVGVESDCEMVDLHLSRLDRSELPELLKRLAAALPGGVELIEWEPLAAQTPSIMRAASAVRYSMHPPADCDLQKTEAAISEILGRRSWPCKRIVKGKRKTVDLRPSIKRLELSAAAQTDGPPNVPGQVVCDLWLERGSSARPFEIANEIWGDARVAIVRRALLFSDQTRQREEPE